MLLKAEKKGYISAAAGWRLYLPKYKYFKSLSAGMENVNWTKYRLGKQDNERYWLLKEANKKNKTDIVFTPLDKEAFTYYKTVKPSVSDYFSIRGVYQRLSLNNPVQTCGSHQIKLALCLIFEWIVENDYLFVVKLCNSVHDEIVAEAPDELAEQVRQIVQDNMRIGGNYFLTNLKIQADANVGQTWGEAK